MSNTPSSASSPGAAAPDLLRDFSADRRLLMLAAMALVVGTAGAGAAWVLLRLIDMATNLAYFGRFSTAPVSIAGNTLGPWAVLVPVAGCLIIGLVARRDLLRVRARVIHQEREREALLRPRAGRTTAPNRAG